MSTTWTRRDREGLCGMDACMSNPCKCTKIPTDNAGWDFLFYAKIRTAICSSRCLHALKSRSFICYLSYITRLISSRIYWKSTLPSAMRMNTVIWAVLLINMHHSSNAQQTRKTEIVALSDSREIDEKQLEPILRWIKDAKIVGISEATHGKNEPLDFRNSLIKVLVKRKLIDVVAIESGSVESKVL